MYVGMETHIETLPLEGQTFERVRMTGCDALVFERADKTAFVLRPRWDLEGVMIVSIDGALENLEGKQLCCAAVSWSDSKSEDGYVWTRCGLVGCRGGEYAHSQVGWLGKADDWSLLVWMETWFDEKAGVFFARHAGSYLLGQGDSPEEAAAGLCSAIRLVKKRIDHRQTRRDQKAGESDDL